MNILAISQSSTWASALTGAGMSVVVLVVIALVAFIIITSDLRK